MNSHINTLSLLLGLACAGAATAADLPREPFTQTRAVSDLPVLTKDTGAPGAGAQAKINEHYGKLPLRFEMNQGQSENRVKFLSRGPGYGLFLTPNEAVLSLTKPQAQARESSAKAEATKSKNAVVRMQLLGANPKPDVAGAESLPGKSNYLIGSDPKHWLINVPHYAKVKYRQVYPGIDLVYHGNQRQLEYDFIVAPGASPKTIKLAFQGTDKMAIDARGDLILYTPHGELTQRKPLIYQNINGQREIIAGHYVLGEDRQIGFQVARYDPEKPLIIDPVMVYSTYLGGQLGDAGRAISVDDDGNAYITGNASDPFSTTPGAYDTSLNGGSDAFVSKLSADGSSLIYSTYLGGSGQDNGYGIAVDSDGHAYVTGVTFSDDFPTTLGALDRRCGLNGTCNGNGDAFVTKLNATGDDLLYSTFLGGNGEDRGRAIAVNDNGEAYVAGRTQSTEFPTTPGAFGRSLGGGSDIFVAKLDATGSSLGYSTYLGGSGNEGPDLVLLGLALGSDDSVYVTSQTASKDFPIKNAFQAAKGNLNDAFVAKLDAAGALLFSTYLGGSGNDVGRSLAVDSEDAVYVTGKTDSGDFPITPNAYQEAYGGGDDDAFVTKFTAEGELIYSTYLGGEDIDRGNGIAVDPIGNAYVTGDTLSTHFPTLDAIQALFGGHIDAFVSKLDATGTTLLYSTYLGGDGGDDGLDIVVHNYNLYITGRTESAEIFPVLAPLQGISGGGQDAFVTKIADPMAALGDVQFNRNAYWIAENRASVTITVTRTGDGAGPVSVDYASANHTAKAGSDYAAVSGTLTWVAGDTTDKTFSVPIIDDTEIEGNETMNLTLSNPSGTTLGTQHSATLTIIDDDQAMLPLNPTWPGFRSFWQP